jgi:hypothetical protein
VRVVPGLAGGAVGLQFSIAARAASRRLVSAGVFSHGCSDRALIMAAISQRVRQLPRHAIISSVDIVFLDNQSEIWSAPSADSRRGGSLEAICGRRRPPVCFRPLDCCFRGPLAMGIEPLEPRGRGW